MALGAGGGPSLAGPREAGSQGAVGHMGAETLAREALWVPSSPSGQLRQARPLPPPPPAPPPPGPPGDSQRRPPGSPERLPRLMLAKPDPAPAIREGAQGGAHTLQGRLGTPGRERAEGGGHPGVGSADAAAPIACGPEQVPLINWNTHTHRQPRPPSWTAQLGSTPEAPGRSPGWPRHLQHLSFTMSPAHQVRRPQPPTHETLQPEPASPKCPDGFQQPPESGTGPLGSPTTPVALAAVRGWRATGCLEPTTWALPHSPSGWAEGETSRFPQDPSCPCWTLWSDRVGRRRGLRFPNAPDDKRDGAVGGQPTPQKTAAT